MPRSRLIAALEESQYRGLSTAAQKRAFGRDDKGWGGLRRAVERSSIPYPLQRAQRVGHPDCYWVDLDWRALIFFSVVAADSLARFKPVGLKVGLGYLRFRFFMVSTRICEMATLRNHLLSEGMTNQGACLRLVWVRMSS